MDSKLWKNNFDIKFWKHVESYSLRFKMFVLVSSCLLFMLKLKPKHGGTLNKSMLSMYLSKDKKQMCHSTTWDFNVIVLSKKSKSILLNNIFSMLYTESFTIVVSIITKKHTSWFALIGDTKERQHKLNIN